jgi:hypothetical protein
MITVSGSPSLWSKLVSARTASSGPTIDSCQVAQNLRWISRYSPVALAFNLCPAWKVPMNEVPAPVKCQHAEPRENWICRSIGFVHADPRTGPVPIARTQDAAKAVRVNASRDERRHIPVIAIMTAPTDAFGLPNRSPYATIGRHGVARWEAGLSAGGNSLRR